MEKETKICQNCKKDFTIEPEDFSFYEKINVPPPTFCPACRFQRRLLFWNPIHLYQRPCDLCKKFNISVYPPDAPYTVYCPQCWWSDKWDPKSFGREYDFKRPFFEQLNELWHTVPLIGLSMDLTTVQTSPYNHDAGYLKNSYLLFHASECENCAYGYYLSKGNMLFDCTAMIQCEYGYDSMHSFRTNRCVGSRHQVSSSIECLFCRDTQDSQNCFATASVRNKKYYVWNTPMTKEEYLAEISKYDLGSYTTYKEVQKKAETHWRTQPVKSEYNEFAINCTGPNIFHSKNVKDSIEVQNTEDSRYLFRMFGPAVKDCYDISMWGVNLSLSYDSVVIGENAARVRFSSESGLTIDDIEYAKLSIGGSHHFGCVSMKKGDYMILNKAYSKEEYIALRAKIVKQMDEVPFVDQRGNTYRYGEFFPPEMSPFAYNTTLAQNFFPLQEVEAKEKHFAWRAPEQHEYTTTIKAADLPDHINNTPDTILKETIACDECGRGYRIIDMEFTFLKSMRLPLPRRCPFCRINEKINLWVKNQERNKRTCAKCGQEMESKYRESEESKVYCKKCYQTKVS